MGTKARRWLPQSACRLARGGGRDALVRDVRDDEARPSACSGWAIAKTPRDVLDPGPRHAYEDHDLYVIVFGTRVLTRFVFKYTLTEPAPGRHPCGGRSALRQERGKPKHDKAGGTWETEDGVHAQRHTRPRQCRERLRHGVQRRVLLGEDHDDGRQGRKEIVEKALVLYYCLQDDDTPAWARGTIMGALGYLILPADAVPDILPGAGYTDDLAVLGVAFALVLAHIKPEHKRMAREKMKEWFGDEPEDSRLAPSR